MRPFGIVVKVAKQERVEAASGVILETQIVDKWYSPWRAELRIGELRRFWGTPDGALTLFETVGLHTAG